MPEHLRKVREKFKASRNPLSPAWAESVLNNDDDADDDKEGHFAGFTGILLMVAQRLHQTVVWIFSKIPFIPGPIRRIRLEEGIQRLMKYQSRVGVSRNQTDFAHTPTNSNHNNSYMIPMQDIEIREPNIPEQNTHSCKQPGPSELKIPKRVQKSEPNLCMNS